jgi:signal transduction histidine kinase
MNEHNTILIVDDTQAGRRVLEQLLSSEGYRIAVASNGIEALERAAELMPDLILLDVRMPGMDGFEVCRRLRADAQLSEVPIMFVTGLGDRDSRLRGIEAGADDFVTKPLDRVELQVRVRAILRLNRYRRLLMERVQRQQAEYEIMRRTMIRDIRAQTRTLNELVENVLEIARIDGARIVHDHRLVDLVRLVREETEKQLPLAQKQGHIMHVVGAEALIITGHDGQLRQVLRNLLNNAIKYTPDGGRIVWECRAYTATAAPPATADIEQAWPERAALPPGRWAAVCVRDTGIGIAQEDLAHVFERFYRVTSQGAISGTGLGLSIAQELVQAHGGRIAAASNIHEGSVFAIYLPLHEEE